MAHPTFPSPGIPSAAANDFFQTLRSSELADAAKPLEDLYQRHLNLVYSIKHQLLKLEKLTGGAQELAMQYRIARTQLFLRKLRKNGLSYCCGPAHIVGDHHVTRKKVSPIFVGDGTYITNICPVCAPHTLKGRWAEHYKTRECRKESGAWQIKKNGEWVPAPEGTRDKTGENAYLVLTSELEEKYKLPPDIHLSTYRLESANRSWCATADEGLW